MDADVLKSVPDCKKCPIGAWRDPPGECRRGDKECPLNVHQPQQEIAVADYEVVG